MRPDHTRLASQLYHIGLLVLCGAPGIPTCPYFFFTSLGPFSKLLLPIIEIECHILEWVFKKKKKKIIFIFIIHIIDLVSRVNNLTGYSLPNSYLGIRLSIFVQYSLQYALIYFKFHLLFYENHQIVYTVYFVMVAGRCLQRVM